MGWGLSPHPRTFLVYPGPNSPNLEMTTHSNQNRESQLLFSKQLESALLYGTVSLLMFGPLAFGAVEPWSIFVLELGSVVLVLLWLAKQWMEGEISFLWN